MEIWNIKHIIQSEERIDVYITSLYDFHLVTIRQRENNRLVKMFNIVHEMNKNAYMISGSRI